MKRNWKTCFLATTILAATFGFGPTTHEESVMADTQRSIAEVLALLATNSKGLISAQDLRDTVVTLQPSLGNSYLSGEVETNLTVEGTYVKLAGNTDEGYLKRFSSLGHLDLIYSGAAVCQAHVIASFAISGETDMQLGFQLALNDTLLPATYQVVMIPGADKYVAVTLVGSVELSTNDQITVWGACLNGTGNITCKSFTMQATGHPK
jgi:hypothetical protein